MEGRARRVRLNRKLYDSAASKLRYCLKMPNYPAVSARSHEDYVAHDNMLVVDDFSAIENLQLIVGGVVQFHNVAFGGIEHGFHMMILSDIPLAETRPLLAKDGLPQP